MRGFVYVLTNRAFYGLVKIGHTTRDPGIRAQELSGTGVPFPFVVALSIEVSDSEAAERAIHQRLRSFRVNKGKEFFKLSVKEAQSFIEESAKPWIYALSPEGIKATKAKEREAKVKEYNNKKAEIEEKYADYERVARYQLEQKPILEEAETFWMWLAGIGVVIGSFNNETVAGFCFLALIVAYLSYSNKNEGFQTAFERNKKALEKNKTDFPRQLNEERRKKELALSHLRKQFPDIL